MRSLEMQMKRHPSGVADRLKTCAESDARAAIEGSRLYVAAYAPVNDVRTGGETTLEVAKETVSVGLVRLFRPIHIQSTEPQT